jgi:hypothetical protein
VKTIGIVEVALFAASAERSPPLATITSTFALRPAVFDGQILAIDITGLAQSDARHQLLLDRRNRRSSLVASTCQIRQPRVALVADDGDETRNVAQPVRRDHAELGQVRTQRIDQVRALLNQPFPAAVQPPEREPPAVAQPADRGVLNRYLV